MTIRRMKVLLVAFLALAFAACGDDSKVGDESLLNFEEQAEQQRLGQTTSTAAPATTAPGAPPKAGVGATTTAPPTTAAPRATTTAPPQQQPSFEIAIHGDVGGQSQFDPAAARVLRGVLVKWVNRDSEARSVEADGGVFSSGPIAPGGSFTWKADTPGRVNYHDGTRPYAVAFVEVVAR